MRWMIERQFRCKDLTKANVLDPSAGGMAA